MRRPSCVVWAQPKGDHQCPYEEEAPGELAQKRGAVIPQAEVGVATP